YSCFFQAEDGIRDATVTGVQTCALPISPEPIGYRSDAQLAPMVRSRGTRPDEPPAPPTRWHPAPAGEVWQSPTIVVPSYSPLCRSEERRVGKECWSERMVARYSRTTV